MTGRHALAGMVTAILLLAGAPAGAEELAPPRWGLSLTIPDGWRWAEPQPFTALVLPPDDGALSAVTTLSLRNLPRPPGTEADRAAETLARRLVDELRAAPVDATIHRERPFRWDVGDGVLMGRQVVADFTRYGLPLRQWTVFLPSPLAPVIHMWQFTAPPGAFPQALPTARAMLDSLRPRAPDGDASSRGDTPSH